jgi:hypothetical protein
MMSPMEMSKHLASLRRQQRTRRASGWSAQPRPGASLGMPGCRPRKTPLTAPRRRRRTSASPPDDIPARSMTAASYGINARLSRLGRWTVQADDEIVSWRTAIPARTIGRRSPVPTPSSAPRVRESWTLCGESAIPIRLPGLRASLSGLLSARFPPTAAVAILNYGRERECSQSEPIEGIIVVKARLDLMVKQEDASPFPWGVQRRQVLL